MKIIPAIYILDGKSVALYKSSYEQKETYYTDPLHMARTFEQDGAKEIYIIDLNGKREDKFIQKDIVKEIIEKTGIPIYIEAGFQSLNEIREAFDIGVSFVVLRSPDLNFIKNAIAEFGEEKIFIQIQAKGSEVIEREDGQKPYETDVVDYAEKLVPLGVKKIVYKDERSEGTLIHPNYDEADRLNLIVGKDMEIYISGGIGDIKHLLLLKKIGVDAAIIGKALYEKHFTLAEAMEAVKD
jgi:phosphoribosylformimino-5-aminoimidazole carboxamide ribotide isomerase